MFKKYFFKMIGSSINKCTRSKSDLLRSYLDNFDHKHMDESVIEFVLLLKKLKIKIVVFDFDRTIIGAHSGGYIDALNDENNIGTAVTSDFKIFSKTLCKNNIKIAVATFSDDEFVRNNKGSGNLIAGEKLVRYCLQKSNCDGITIEKVYGYYPHYYQDSSKYKKLGLKEPMTGDKSYHLERIRNEFSVTFEEILFIDDDLRNCKSARKEGYLTFNVTGKQGFNFRKLEVL